MASKMYILVKDSVPPGFAIVAAAHASLGGYLHFVDKERSSWMERDRDVATGRKTAAEDWADSSFSKAVCSVTGDQFEEAKTYGVAGEDYRVMTESALAHAEVVIVFRPRDDWEPFFKSLPLWGKGQILVIDGLSVPVPHTTA